MKKRFAVVKIDFSAGGAQALHDDAERGSGVYAQNFPVLTVAARWRPKAGLFSEILLSVVRMAIVTLWRARSTAEAAFRSAPEAGRPRQLAGQELDLLASLRRTLRVVRALGLVELLAEVSEPPPILGFGLVIEQWARISRIARDQRPDFEAPGVASDVLFADPGQVEREEFAPRVAEQLGEVGEALGIPQAERLSLVRDRPVLAFAAKELARRPGVPLPFRSVRRAR